MRQGSSARPCGSEIRYLHQPAGRVPQQVVGLQVAVNDGARPIMQVPHPWGAADKPRASSKAAGLSPARTQIDLHAR